MPGPLFDMTEQSQSPFRRRSGEIAAVLRAVISNFHAVIPEQQNAIQAFENEDLICTENPT